MFFAATLGYSQSKLDLKEIMKGQEFTGYWPEAPQWSLDGSCLYFRWNKDGKEDSEPFQYVLKTKQLEAMDEVQWKSIIPFDASQISFPTQLSVVQQSMVLTDRKTMKSQIHGVNGPENHEISDTPTNRPFSVRCREDFSNTSHGSYGRRFLPHEFQ
jgi:hypothetical protein